MNTVLAVLAVGLLAGPMSAHAVVIVDTGTPTGIDEYRFAESQYFGGEFTIASRYSINSLEGYVSNDLGAAGNVYAGIYSDGGNSPGAFYSQAHSHSPASRTKIGTARSA